MRRSILVLGKPFWLAPALLLCSFPGWSQQAPLDQRATSALADPQDTQASARGQQYTQQQTGSISGKVIDQSGTDIAGAVVTLKREGQSSELEATSNGDGLFRLPMSLQDHSSSPFHPRVSPRKSSPGLCNLRSLSSRR